MFNIDKNEEITEILHGTENTVNRGVHFMQNAREHMDLFGERNGPSIIIEYKDIYKNNYIAAKNRGVKIRFITEITKDNIHYCKEIRDMVDEMRHLEGLVGGIAVTEKEYMTTTTLKNKQLLTQVFYSNAFEVVKQGQYIFNTFWEKAIPADQRIQEIEEGIEPIKTKILENHEEIYNHLKVAIKRSSERNVCSSIGGMRMVYDNFFNFYKDILERHKIKGEDKGIKWLTFIDNDKENIELVKKFLDAGIQVRHIKNLPSMNFSVDSKSIQATIDSMDKGKLMSKLLVSNERAYINHFNLYFQELWNNFGIDAKERIRNIEEGLEHDTEVIIHSDRTLDLYLDIIQSIQSEIFFIFPTPKAFVRQLKAIFLAKQISKERKVKVRILTPTNDVVKAWIPSLLHKEREEKEEKEEESKDDDINNKHTMNSCSYGDIEIRYIEKMAQTKATIIVADRKESLVMELKDDTKDTFIEAIGLCTHSTSKANVLSYVAIFENLWRQSEIYHELKESNKNLLKANEKLKINDKMQKEFIDTAAHELRTPIQPILSLSDLLANKIKDEKDQDMIKIIYKSAKKLSSLTKDILDVTKIEGNKLDLNKNVFSIVELLQSIITEYESLGYTKKIKFALNINNIDSNTTAMVFADRNRIAQVISNLINNSIKFISIEEQVKQKQKGEETVEENIDGKIIIKVEKIKTNHDTNEHHLGKKVDKVIVVSIKDNGKGIDPDIFPRLFTKFTSNSFQGTGLGLYISKNIVEAHGGKMWAGNNDDGKGAIFSFSIPLINTQF